MNRSLSTATAISVVLHFALLLTLLRNRDQPPLAGAPTVMNITFWEQDDRQLSGASSPEPAPQSGEPAAKPTAPDPGPDSPRATDRAPAEENAGMAAASTPAGPAAGSVDEIPVEQAEAAVGADQQQPVMPRSDLLATISPRELRLPPPSEGERALPERVPMSPQEQQMLGKKFRQWSEEYYRNTPADAGISWEYRGQQYRAEFTPEPAADNTGIEYLRVEVSSEADGARKSVHLRMKRLAFSNFAQFVDRWDPEVQVHDDELDGRFHTNSTIHLGSTRSAMPRFLGKVTTSSRGIDTSASQRRVRRDEIFLGGLETAVGAIVLPKRFLPFPTGAAVEPEQVRNFEHDTRITFYADGTYGWKAVGAPAAEVTTVIPSQALYLIGGAKKKLYLSGVVRGKVLVYSPERIVITGNLTYARDPLAKPGTGDYLGLVCDKTIEVAHPDVTGPGDLEVNAAIYARRRFTVTGYRLREHALLSIYGSLTAGTLSATEPRFATRIQFDRRLENARPPGFPMSDRYELEAWDGNWEVQAAGGILTPNNARLAAQKTRKDAGAGIPPRRFMTMDSPGRLA